MIQTVEEFLKGRVYITEDGIEDVHDSLSRVVDACKDLIRLHVEEALKEVRQKVNYYEDTSKGFAIDPNTISYDLNKIK